MPHPLEFCPRNGQQSLNETLANRTQTYGPWADNAAISQQLKEAMTLGTRWEDLPDFAREGLTMIAQKMARILTAPGGHRHTDNWRDIAGYATLCERETQPTPTLATPETPASFWSLVAPYSFKVHELEKQLHSHGVRANSRASGEVNAVEQACGLIVAMAPGWQHDRATSEAIAAFTIANKLVIYLTIPLSPPSDSNLWDFLRAHGQSPGAARDWRMVEGLARVAGIDRRGPVNVG